MSDEKKNENNNADTKPENKEIPPMTESHILVITELAQLGMMFLKNAIPQYEADLNKDSGAGARKRQHFSHLKSLYEVAGPETVSHFQRICEMLIERAAEKAKAECEMFIERAAEKAKAEAAEQTKPETEANKSEA